jgi:hypothetical protein
MADRGKWTKAQLHEYKKNPPTPEFVRETFMWAETSILYRLGGSYAADNKGGMISIAGQPILWEDRSPDGRLLFSMDFFGGQGQLLLAIREGAFTVASSAIWDLDIGVGATYLKLWLGKKRPGLEINFRRLTLAEVAGGLARDMRGAAEGVGRSAPPDLVRATEETGLYRHVASHRLDSDGRVPLVEITRARLFGGGRMVEIWGNKISGEGGGTLVVCSSYGNQGAAFAF